MKLADLNLTARQMEHLKFIREFIAKDNMSPTFEEIAQHFGKSRASTYGVVSELARKGAITMLPRCARSIQLTDAVTGPRTSYRRAVDWLLELIEKQAGDLDAPDMARELSSRALAVREAEGGAA